MSGTQAIIDAVRDLGGGDLLDLPGGANQALVLPQGKGIHSLKKLIDEYRTTPERIETKAVVLSAQSLIDYLQRFHRSASAVFVVDDPAAPSMLGMVDYHDRQDGEDEPQFCRHRVTYKFPLSDEMKAWRHATSRGLIGQEEFATFLQDRAHDIANPPLDWMQLPRDQLDIILDLLNLHDDQGEIDDAAAADVAVEAADESDERYVPRSAIYKLRRARWGSAQRLVALARGIEVAANGKATAGFNPRTGERTVSYTEEHETRSGGRRVFVPDGFFVHIPVFEHGDRHLMPVRLRYRVQAGAVKWGVELVDAARVVRLAVRNVAETVANDTHLPVFYGTPES